MKLNQLNSENDHMERQNFREQNYPSRNNYRFRQYNNGMILKIVTYLKTLNEKRVWFLNKNLM